MDFPDLMNTSLFVEGAQLPFDMFREQSIAKQTAQYEGVLSGTWEFLLKASSRQSCQTVQLSRYH